MVDTLLLSGYVCPHCSECTNIFSSGGGKLLAEHSKLPFLGTVPIEPGLALAAEAGENYLEKFETSETSKCFMRICEIITSKTSD